MEDLIIPEISVLRMLAGQRPFVWTPEVEICVEELASRGLCTFEARPRITGEGLRALERATDTIDFRSRAVI
jgi:hypothetical protein